MTRFAALPVLAALLAGCASQQVPPTEPSPGHLRPAPEPAAPSDIPEPVTTRPILPEPSPAPSPETYTVVVSEVPVKELLFALARDAELNVDISQDIQGLVTLNAVDQTLPQILERLSRQVDLRYEFEDDTLVVMPDRPFLRTYQVDYVNLSRTSNSTISLSTEVASVSGGGLTGAGGGAGTTGDGGGTGGSGSTVNVENESDNLFWSTVEENIRSILGSEAAEDVISNAAAGVMVVRATRKQHEQVQEYLDRVLSNARRQVMIEATIVEIELSDEYQSGVDWSKVELGQGISLLAGNPTDSTASLATAAFGAASNTPFFILDAQEEDVRDDGVNLTVRLLKEFGDTQVLSSPKLMALNNQTALLKVVDNRVFFEIESLVSQNQTGSVTATNTTIRTVPVGIVMAITPQISESDTVILNVRPTISRVSREVVDPSRDANGNPLGNTVPEIAVREMESVLKMDDGQIAVLGGLMQNQDTRDTSGIPGISEVEGLGEAFKYRRADVSKTELVIFIRPVIVREPSIDRDLQDFRPFLERALSQRAPAVQGGDQP